MRLIWPPPGFSWYQKPGGDNWVNDSGLVFQIRWGSSAFLITGYISQKSEKQLVELYGRDLASTVLVAPHHGSRTSLSPEFLEAVGADYIVFSAGRNNYAGLPHPETVERALAGGATIWRTDQSGAAVFEVGKDNNKVELIEWRN